MSEEKTSHYSTRIVVARARHTIKHLATTEVPLAMCSSLSVCMLCAGCSLHFPCRCRLLPSRLLPTILLVLPAEIDNAHS